MSAGHALTGIFQVFVFDNVLFASDNPRVMTLEQELRVAANERWCLDCLSEAAYEKVRDTFIKDVGDYKSETQVQEALENMYWWEAFEDDERFEDTFLGQSMLARNAPFSEYEKARKHWTIARHV